MLELSEVLGGEALQFLVEGEEDGDPDDWDPKARSSVYMVTCYEPKETETDKMRPSTLTRQAFADLIIEAYKETNPMRQVVRWCVVLEWPGPHFHMAVNSDQDDGDGDIDPQREPKASMAYSGIIYSVQNFRQIPNSLSLVTQ